jgi:hypothetical protein
MSIIHMSGSQPEVFVQVPSEQRKVTFYDINRQGSILTYVDIGTFITISISFLCPTGCEGSFSEEMSSSKPPYQQQHVVRNTKMRGAVCLPPIRLDCVVMKSRCGLS